MFASHNMQIAFLLLIFAAKTFSSAFLPPSSFVPRASSTTNIEAKKSKQKKKKKPQAKGGGFGATQKKSTPSKSDLAFDKAIKAKVEEVTRDPMNAVSWLELGSVLVKLGDYAEAEQVFCIGDACAPGNEMLHGAYVALAGNSAEYFGGSPTKEVDPNALQCPFDTYEVGQPAEDFRTVTWTAPGDRPRVQVSQAPLIPKEECTWAIEETERWAAENGGWTNARHAQAATTDLPVKDVPKLLEWFNEKLETTLFPMLASRYADKISSASDLRAHDSFIVKYDAERQNSLVKHLDESAFSFTIALNDRSDYEGGGTCFEGIRLKGAGDKYEPLTLNADAGGVVAFPGTIKHGGAAVTKGLRYIIPLFIYLHENKSGNPKGYIANDLEPLIEKANKRRKMMSSNFS